MFRWNQLALREHTSQITRVVARTEFKLVLCMFTKTTGPKVERFAWTRSPKVPFTPDMLNYQFYY